MPLEAKALLSFYRQEQALGRLIDRPWASGYINIGPIVAQAQLLKPDRSQGSKIVWPTQVLLRPGAFHFQH